MSTECDIHFNTSFRNFMIGDPLPTFLSEGFCELYGAAPLRSHLSELESTSVGFFRNNLEVSKDSFGAELKMYNLKDIIPLIERVYSSYLANSEAGIQSKSSLTVCLGILKAIQANSCQSENELVVMLYFH